MILYHYCSNEAFLSILKSQSLWASEFSLSNDLLEGKWVKKLVAEACDERAITPPRKEYLLAHLDQEIAQTGAAGFCMSEHGDVLSQWRGYANDGAGVAIGFESVYFETLTGKAKRESGKLFELKKLEYDVDRQKSAIKNNLAKIFAAFARVTMSKPLSSTIGSSAIYDMYESELSRELFGLYLDSYILKNPAFREELEWRLIAAFPTTRYLRDPAGDPSAYWDLEMMEFRGLRDRIVPFVELKLDEVEERAVAEVILGPKNITPPRIVQAALARYGWGPSIPVKRSAASYR